MAKQADGKYTCDTCGVEMVAKVGNTYFTDVVDAINNSELNNGSYATLLTDVFIDKDVTIANAAGKYQSFCLDLAGHTLTCSGVFSVGPGVPDSDRYTALDISGRGSINADIRVKEEGCLDLTDWMEGTVTSVTVEKYGSFHCGYNYGTTEISKGKIKQLQCSSGSTVALQCGTYEDIYNNGSVVITLGKLLTNYCAFRDKDENLLKRTEMIAGQDHLRNVTVEACTTHIDEDSNGSCDYCDTSVSASVTTESGKTYYESFSDAFAAANKNTGCTLTLLSDVSDPPFVTGSFTLDLNGHKIDYLSVGQNYDIEIINHWTSPFPAA